MIVVGTARAVPATLIDTGVLGLRFCEPGTKLIALAAAAMLVGVVEDDEEDEVVVVVVVVVVVTELFAIRSLTCIEA